jgi:hypothetical protein
MSTVTLESALRILVRARNLRSYARPAIRALVREDITRLRLMRAGLPEVTYLEN